MLDMGSLNIQLSDEEIRTLSGEHGETMRKVMESVVRYGEALGAKKLVDLEGDGHFVISWSRPGISPPIEMLEELVSAGLETKFPFTLDPCAPLDFNNLHLDSAVEDKIRLMFKNQVRYDELMLALGMRDKHAYTCNPYQPEIGNIPKQGTILAWSESACAIFANSVLGARTNRNGAIMDLLLNITGKAPLTGLLLDEGRKAIWLINVDTEQAPNPWLLGAVIGKKVIEDVPYITGLDRALSDFTQTEIYDYLQEMGSACATFGAVGLFHAENITPEAMTSGRELLSSNHRVLEITHITLQKELDSYPILWSDKNLKPQQCYIGCPHLSYSQISSWIDEISNALTKRNQKKLAVGTVLFSAPQILQKIKDDQERYDFLTNAGISLSPTCCETIFETGLITGQPILTNSNKLRTYTSARYLPDSALIETIVSGEIKKGSIYV